MPTDVTIQLGIRIRSVYIACISMTFELTGNTCALLLIGVASTFGMVKDSQTCATSVTKCEKNGKANNERVPKSFEQLTKHEDIVVSRDGHSWLSVFASVFASVS